MKYKNSWCTGCFDIF